MQINKIINGDCLEVLKTFPSEFIDCCITSPPYYGLRDYGVDNQIGLEKTPNEFVSKLVDIFKEVKRVLKEDGTLWLNLGDSYAGSNNGSNDYRSEHISISKSNKKYQGQKPGLLKGLKPKNLIGIPWRVAFALQNDGWYLRQDIIWHKPNPMPESVTDRCTKAHEYIFLLSKYPKYYFDNEVIKCRSKQDWGTRDRTNGKYHNKGTGLSPHGGLEKAYEMCNKRSVWSVATKPFRGSHFATFPEDLIEPMVKAGCKENGVVLDIFMGAGTTALVSKKLNRNYIGIELNPKYIQIAEKRLLDNLGLLFESKRKKTTYEKF